MSNNKHLLSDSRTNQSHLDFLAFWRQSATRKCYHVWIAATYHIYIRNITLLFVHVMDSDRFYWLLFYFNTFYFTKYTTVDYRTIKDILFYIFRNFNFCNKFVIELRCVEFLSVIISVKTNWFALRSHPIFVCHSYWLQIKLDSTQSYSHYLYNKKVLIYREPKELIKPWRCRIM